MEKKSILNQAYESPIVEILPVGEDDVFTASDEREWSPWY